MFLRLFELGYALWMCVIADVCVSACVCVSLCARVSLCVCVCVCVSLCSCEFMFAPIGYLCARWSQLDHLAELLNSPHS